MNNIRAGLAYAAVLAIGACAVEGGGGREPAGNFDRGGREAGGGGGRDPAGGRAPRDQSDAGAPNAGERQTGSHATHDGSPSERDRDQGGNNNQGALSESDRTGRNPDAPPD